MNAIELNLKLLKGTAEMAAAERRWEHECHVSIPTPFPHRFATVALCLDYWLNGQLLPDRRETVPGTFAIPAKKR